MDAISFVLGINSHHLRSSNLKDLIYNPPSLDDVKPTRAYVRLVYILSDEDEVQFTRRYLYWILFFA